MSKFVMLRQIAMNIVVRKAVREDAEVIAKVVSMAIGDEEALRNYCGNDFRTVLTVVAQRESTQYSWQNALVAEVDGIVAGAIIGYAGARLGELRNGTYAVLREIIGRVPTIADETEPGEYYIDSVGVLPEFRGLGVGKELIIAFCRKTFIFGGERVGLIVDYNNPQANKLYNSLGFERVGSRCFLGHNMWHLQKVL